MAVEIESGISKLYMGHGSPVVSTLESVCGCPTIIRCSEQGAYLICGPFTIASRSLESGAFISYLEARLLQRCHVKDSQVRTEEFQLFKDTVVALSTGLGWNLRSRDQFHCRLPRADCRLGYDSTSFESNQLTLPSFEWIQLMLEGTYPEIEFNS